MGTKAKPLPVVPGRPDDSWLRQHPYMQDGLLMSPWSFFLVLFLAMGVLYWWFHVKRRMVQRLATFRPLVLLLIVYSYQCVNYMFAFYWAYAFVDTMVQARENGYGLFCNAVDEAVSAQGLKFATRFNIFVLFLFVRTFFKTFLVLTGPTFREEYNFFLFFFTEWRGVILWWFAVYTAPGGENYLPMLAECFSYFFDSLENLVLTRDLKPKLYVRGFTAVIILQMIWDMLASCEYPRYTVLRFVFWVTWKAILLLLGYVLRVAAEEVEQETAEATEKEKQKQKQQPPSSAGGPAGGAQQHRSSSSAFFGSAFKAFNSFASSFAGEDSASSRGAPPPAGWDDRWFHAPPPPPAEGASEQPPGGARPRTSQPQPPHAQQQQQQGKRGKRGPAAAAAPPPPPPTQSSQGTGGRSRGRTRSHSGTSGSSQPRQPPPQPAAPPPPPPSPPVEEETSYADYTNTSHSSFVDEVD